MRLRVYLGFRTTAAAVAATVALAWAVPAAAQHADAVSTVVVTATRHAMLEVDAPASTSVVTRDEIAARGADDVLDAIRGETGISLQGRSIGGRKVLSIRGLDSKHTLFLVDGRRVGASDGVIGHSDFQYDWIPVDDIERIEIVRGPLSVLYGSEAMGGVVNVITRQPGERWRFGGSVEGLWAESDGRGGDGYRLGARADGPLGERASLRLGAAHSRRDALASVADARIDELEGQDKRDAWIGLGWRPAAGHRVDVEHRRGDERRWANARERSGARRYHETVNDIERAMSSIAWDADWAPPGQPGMSTQLRAYVASLDVVNTRTEGVTPNPPQRIEDRVLDGMARTDAGRHGLTAGFELRNESLEDPGLPDGRSTARHRALFVQDEIALGGSVDLTLGVRHDRHSLFGSQTSPRAYLVWRAGGGWVVKGGYSHGFKAPNLKQIVPGERREGPNAFLGNPDLKAETSDGVEVGIGHVAGGREFQLVVFDQRVEDLIEVQLVAPGPVPGIGTYTYVNLSEARFRGVEASLAQPLGAGFTALLSYTYLDARDGDGERLDKRPRHSATARLDWTGARWRAGVRVEYTAAQRLPATTGPAQAVPDITLWGAHLARTLAPGVELALGVDNLTDVRLADESPLFTYVEWPRTWRLTLRGQF
ncbi:TonB-dependent receptor [Calidifontimicrobium sp. SYSU G02091]|uniref:TonB-dependent receptor plug domain-containing protein n=1 Tax=Calidifontimicrobium sp. SYSU G02091 TaxID=2926421 RepID=UPI001F53760B|nr:TonB-dependent receptor [Calidifontimicrobium sp. SYSU G02091]MCI1190946.1 TonB-dependent receptor [Calidifontimicrobium sp. SYSU G02091]